MWKTAATLINENPITGNGFSAYSDRVQDIRKSGQNPNNVKDYKMPHNEFIHLLVNGGLISLILLISILAALIKTFHSFNMRPEFKVAGYLLILQFSVFSISEIFFSTKLPIIYFCIASAFIIYAGLLEQRANNSDLELKKITL
jgi:O-antigen ligase